MTQEFSKPNGPRPGKNDLRPLPYLFIHLLVLLSLSTGCSLLLELNQCESDGDCVATSQCVEGLCAEVNRINVRNHIVEDTTWTSDNVYVLENLIMVVAPATLTIEAGTTILGRRNTGLVSLSGARLEAVGTRDNPIVFTSDKPVGQRLAGDWAGIAMVGQARTNRQNFALRIITDQFDTRVGGDDDTWNCGTLRYVRVEFGGSEVDGQKALNGITLAGCGSGTTVEYIQSHMSDDDGIAVFGGTVDIRYAVSTRAGDDGFDFDTGWRGTAQFLAIQQDPNGEEAIELENLAENPSALPQTDAQIYNFTIIGSQQRISRQVGLYVKFGGRAVFSHGIITNSGGAGVYIEGPEAKAHAENGGIIVENTIFHEIGPEGNEYFRLVDGEDGFDGYEIYSHDEANNLFGVDPGLADPFNLDNPGWVPSPEFTTNVSPPPAGFDPTAVYRGAFSPSATPWTEGWTAYPRH